MDPYTLLREILAKDRAAIAEIQEILVGYQPPEKMLTMHRRIEEVLLGENRSVISYIAGSATQPRTIYLADGKRITVGRSKITRGPAWLCIEDAPTVSDQ